MVRKAPSILNCWQRNLRRYQSPTLVLRHRRSFIYGQKVLRKIIRNIVHTSSYEYFRRIMISRRIDRNIIRNHVLPFMLLWQECFNEPNKRNIFCQTSFKLRTKEGDAWDKLDESMCFLCQYGTRDC